jgi:hypothetical protein
MQELRLLSQAVAAELVRRVQQTLPAVVVRVVCYCLACH